MALIQRIVSRTIHYKRGDSLVGVDICSCDTCNNEYEQKISQTISRRNAKLANGRDLCKTCMSIEMKILIATNGAAALARQSPEKRKENASKAGKISAANYDPIISKGRFTTERWNEKTLEEQYAHAKRGNDGLQEKLKDPIFAAQHFAKVLAQKQLGYMSKAHKDLHELIKDFGFVSHVQIGSMQVDECNEELKIVIEYNGDMWHCNPRKWKADEYNSAIRMTAGEKWQKDIARHKMLKSMGYTTVIIWESGWIEDAKKYLTKIKELYNEISEQKRNP